MKFFLDTANIDEIKEAAALGVLDGVTTNPTLVAREKRPLRELIEEICTIVDGPVNAEVLSTETEGMLEEGRSLAKIHPNISVKIPMIKDGMKAVRILSEEGIKTNVTLTFSSPQAILAARAGATFVSPFVGRLDDAGHNGMDLIREIVEIYGNYGFSTEVLVASVRNPLHVIEAGLAGAHIATIPFKVLLQLYKHPLTDVGLEKFLQDSKKVPKD